MPLKITELWAWIATERDGSEGVVGMHTEIGWAPLIGADRERIESHRDHAMALRAKTGLPIKLMRFASMTVVEELS